MRPRPEWLGILGIALLIRVAFVLGYPQPPVVDDAAAYDVQARQLAFERGFLSAWTGDTPLSKGPVYPMMLAAIYRVAGHDYPAVRLVQALVSAASVGLQRLSSE